MCGITGIWHLDGTKVDSNKINKFNDSLTHRGPDGFGISSHLNGTLSLGHRRLSILDLSEAGKQPMRYADDNLTMTFNGEIFNYLEVREELISFGYVFRSNTDSEVVLAAYHKWGKDCLDRFNGMWAIVIWDNRNNELFMARDRFGIKPLYYVYLPNKMFAFASETYAFKYLVDYQRQINERHYQVACADPMKLEGEGVTVFEGIDQLLPGHYLTLQLPLQIVQKRWWSIDDNLNETSNSDIKHQADRLKELLIDSCKLRLQSDVKIGTALSGGLDSSVILSIVNDLLIGGGLDRISQQKQEAFTITFPGLDNDETEFAKRAFTYTTNAQHHLIEANTSLLPEQIVNDSRIADYVGNWPLTSASLVYKTMKQSGVSVSLDGHGVDEMMYGYKSMISDLFYDALIDPKKNPSDYAKVLKGFGNNSDEKARIDLMLAEKEIRERSLIFKGKQLLKSLNIENRSTAITLDKPVSKIYDFSHFPYEKQMLYSEFFKTRLPTLLRNFDRASMINSVEVRMPFLDWRLVCLIFSLPLSSKINSGYTKHILRECMKGGMNEDIRLRKSKVGISSPIEHWFNAGLSDWFIESVNDNQLKNELKGLVVSKRPFSAALLGQAWKNVNRTILEE